jgi:hypothetical protein
MAKRVITSEHPSVACMIARFRNIDFFLTRAVAIGLLAFDQDEIENGVGWPHFSHS